MFKIKPPKWLQSLLLKHVVLDGEYTEKEKAPLYLALTRCFICDTCGNQQSFQRELVNEQVDIETPEATRACLDNLSLVLNDVARENGWYFNAETAFAQCPKCSKGHQTKYKVNGKQVD